MQYIVLKIFKLFFNLLIFKRLKNNFFLKNLLCRCVLIKNWGVEFQFQTIICKLIKICNRIWNRLI